MAEGSPLVCWNCMTQKELDDLVKAGEDREAYVASITEEDLRNMGHWEDEMICDRCNEPLKKEPNKVKKLSMCGCSHSGDGENSEHSDYLPGAEGHGQCLKCNCRKFTWAGWIVEPKEPKPTEENFKELPRRVMR